MDKQLPPPQVVRQPSGAMPTQQMLPKQNNTQRLIFFLFLCAVIVTGIVYVLYPSQIKPKNTAITPTIATTPEPTPKETTKWQTYTNTQYHYSFFYPVTWKIVPADKDLKEFELQYQNKKDPAVIRVTYLSNDEKSTMQPSFCETNDLPVRCHTYTLTANSKALVDRLTLANNTTADALITLPQTGTLHLQITHPNATSSESYNTLTILIDTLKFPNEARAYGMQICPDTWPTTAAEVDYNGIKIATADLDKDWIKTNCK